VKTEWWSWKRFAYGTLGALAPEGIRLHNAYPLLNPAAGTLIPHLTAGYVSFSLLFIFIGGAFASAWGDNNPVKCLYVGATFPVILSAWGQTAPPASPK